MKKSIVCFHLFIALILFSCSSPTPIPTIQPTLTATITPTLPSPTATAAPSPTENAETDFPEGCISLRSVDFNPAAIDGFFVGFDSSDDRHLLDPKNKQFLDIDKNGHQLFFPGWVNPNRQYMLATDNSYKFQLRTAEKVINANIPDFGEWMAGRWLDNEHMAFLRLKEPKQDVIILNPFTGTYRSIRISIPDFKIEQAGPGFHIVYLFIDPTLKRVFYNDENGRFVLWDIETRKEIAVMPSPYSDESFLPWEWSPDGTKIITPIPEMSAGNQQANELFTFDTEGKLEQLTHLNSKYEFANVEGSSWSPDGRHIGFWLKIGSAGSNPRELHQWLAVLDTQTLATTIYCLADKIQPSSAWSPVWSPDGQQLIVNFGSRLDGTLTPILVDIIDKTQSVIDTQNMTVEDWMAP
jgi:hypothetical protein